MQDRHGLGTDLRAATRFCWRHPLPVADGGPDARRRHRRQHRRLLGAERHLFQAAADRATPTASCRSARRTEAPSPIPSIWPLRECARPQRAHRRRPHLDDARLGHGRRTDAAARRRRHGDRRTTSTRSASVPAREAGCSGRRRASRPAARGCPERRRLAAAIFGSDPTVSRADDPSPSRALHHRRRRAGWLHRHPDRLQPGPLGPADAGAAHRRQYRHAWRHSAWLGLPASSNASESAGDGARRPDGQWTAEGRGDVRGGQPDPARPIVVHAGAREPAAAHRSSSRS